MTTTTAALERRKLERIFAIFDANKSGTIEQADFAQLADIVAEGRHWPLDGEEARALRQTLVGRFDHMLSVLDRDRDGVVTLAEWLQYNESHPPDDALDRILEQTVFGAFASDNNAGVHPAILEALTRVNVGYAGAYGHDLQTRQAVATIREQFGDCDPYFVFNGTAANVLGLKAVTSSWHSIVCADTAHIVTDEAAAPENYLGCKLIIVRTPDGKLTVPLIDRHRVRYDGIDRHNPTRVVSITNPTEYGTVYTPAEVRAIADYCHAHDILLHLDGARIFNAAVATGATLRELTSGAGVDVFSLGGTKNGMMMARRSCFSTGGSASTSCTCRSRPCRRSPRCGSSLRSSTPCSRMGYGTGTPRRPTRWRSSSARVWPSSPGLSWTSRSPRTACSSASHLASSLG